MAIEVISHVGRLNENVPLDFSEAPVITPRMYEDRIAALLDSGREFTHIVIYADREHFSNLE